VTGERREVHRRAVGNAHNSRVSTTCPEYDAEHSSDRTERDHSNSDPSSTSALPLTRFFD
jgi:hypothetical protein